MNRTTFAVLIWLHFSLPAWTQTATHPSSLAGNEFQKQDPQIFTTSPATRHISETQGTPIEELILLMLSRNKELEATRERIHQAEARLAQARLRPNPVFDANRATDTFFAREGEGSFSFTVSQPIELGGKRVKRIGVAEAEIQMTKAQIADAERQLKAQLQTFFGDALGAAARMDLLERTSGVNREMWNVMKVRLSSGDASRLDQNLLVAAINQIEAQRVQAENQLGEFLLQIKTLAGIPPEEPLALRGRLEAPGGTITEEAALAAALQYRPDLQAARLREEMAEARIALAKAQAIPNISAFTRYTKDALVIEGLPAPQEKIVDRDSLLTFGISIPLPLFNREQGNIAEAVSERVQARAQREAAELMVRRDVSLACRRYQAARRALDVLSGGVVAENEESLRIVKLSYNLGEMRLLDLLNQQRILIDAQMTYAATQKDYYVAFVDLERAVGKGVALRQ